ncbi:MAG: nicotinate (nicotinamide) nucleotide adenylyltransferase [Candidatus Dormibacteria bacterium]
MSAFAGATGVLGGTFDPVHLGHLAVARQCLAELQLAEVRLVPSFTPPHREAPVATAEDRLAMARLAVSGEQGLAVDDVELRRGGVSYTVDTLRELGESGCESLVLLLGYDAALELESWHRAADIPHLAAVVAFNRTDVARTRRGLPAGTAVLEVNSPRISATEIRRRLASGLDMSGMLAGPVLAYICERGLYGAGK